MNIMLFEESPFVTPFHLSSSPFFSSPPLTFLSLCVSLCSLCFIRNMWTDPNQIKQTNTKTKKTHHWLQSLEIRGLCYWTIRNCWNSASGYDVAMALMSSHTGAPEVVGVIYLSQGKVPVSATLWSLFYRKAWMALNTQASGEITDT